MVAERAFVAQRLGRVNVAFDDEVGVGKTVFNLGEMFLTRGQARSTIQKRRACHPANIGIKTTLLNRIGKQFSVTSTASRAVFISTAVSPEEARLTRCIPAANRNPSPWRRADEKFQSGLPTTGSTTQQNTNENKTRTTRARIHSDERTLPGPNKRTGGRLETRAV